jgi:hypothetical protein
MTKLKCPKCNHVWDYKGEDPYFATWPSLLEEGQSSEVQGRVIWVMRAS